MPSSPSSNPLLIYGNENALYQVILNLVINAKDAIKAKVKVDNGPNAITISVSQHEETHSTQCSAGFIEPGQYAHLCVSDTGIGISDDLLHHIFDPFVSSKGDEGTGLGLSIVYNTVVAGLKGAINVECVDQTYFHVYIPLSKE
jgi:signal transduction histidine kinase